MASVLPASAWAQGLVARVNAGGPSVVDDLGRTWDADSAYSPGGRGHEGGVPVPILSRPDGFLMGGAGNPLRRVYSTSRAGWSHYRFDLPNGDYLVRLTLAEILNQGVNLRSMDVSVEGAPLLTAFDMAAAFGVQYGGQVSTLAHVVDGRLDIAGSGGPGTPEIAGALVCGIEVWTAPVAFGVPPVVTGVEARASYGANLVTWDWQPDATLAGWRVWSLDSPVGQHAHAFPQALDRWVPLVDLPASPPRLHDHDAAPGLRRLYRVAALGLDGQVGPMSNVVVATALENAATSLPRFEITIDQADWDFIAANLFTLPDDEVPALLTTAGSTRPVEVRYRGGSSRLLSKLSWKIKLSAAEALDGRRDLNLKASFLDPALIREALAHDLFSAVGQVSSAIHPVHLEVNGSYLGLFNEAEDVDEAWLAVRDREITGDLFKCDANLQPLSNPASYPIAYDKKTNEGTGHASLIALIEFLDAPPGPNFVRDLVDVFDVDAYLSYLAVVAWIADLDSIWHNYYLHENLDLGRWEFFPWDNDLSFALIGNLLSLSVLYGSQPGAGLINQLRVRVLEQPELLWRFCQKITELEERFANEAWLTARIEAATALRRTDALADPFKVGWESALLHEQDLAKLRSYPALRNPIVDQEIATLQPATPPTVLWINEIVAERQVQIGDEQGEFEDWVEILNAGPAALDLGGRFLTDDLSDPTRFAFPNGTIVPAGGHLVVWCDGEPGDGPLHAPFTLGEAGGELGLFAADGATLLDFAAWNRQYPGLSFGRYRDAGAFLELLPTPTPGAANTTAGNWPPTLTWITTAPAVPGSDDAFEVTCHSTDVDGLAAVELHWRTSPGAFASRVLAPLGADRFSASLPPQADGTTIEYYLTSTDLLGRSAVKPAGGADDPFVVVVADSVLVHLRISELMASNSSTIQDEAGDFEDWIELHNTAPGSFDLGGMFLSDDLGNSTKWEFPAGTMIAGGGHLLVWADDEAGEGPLHASFKLGAGGEDVALFDTLANGNALVTGYSFPAQTSDQSFGALPDGGDLRFRFPVASPGTSNQPAPGGARVYRHSDPSVSVMTLSVAGPVQVGGAFMVAVANAPVGQPASLFVSFAPADDPVPGGFALIALPPAGSLAFSIGAGGTGSASFPIPMSPGLIGTPVYAQVSAAGGGLSDALAATIGP